MCTASKDVYVCETLPFKLNLTSDICSSLIAACQFSFVVTDNVAVKVHNYNCITNVQIHITTQMSKGKIVPCFS